MDEAITMMAWIYPDELPGGGQENKFTIFYKNTYYLQIEPGAGQLAYYFYDTSAPGYHISDGKVKARRNGVMLPLRGTGAKPVSISTGNRVAKPSPRRTGAQHAE